MVFSFRLGLFTKSPLICVVFLGGGFLILLYWLLAHEGLVSRKGRQYVILCLIPLECLHCSARANSVESGSSHLFWKSPYVAARADGNILT